MKTESNATSDRPLIISVLAFCTILLALHFCGCSSDPGPTDPGSDADVVTPDSGTTTDSQTTTTDAQVSDPCAAYVGHTDGWTCSTEGGFPYACNFTLATDGTTCYIGCDGHFGAVAPILMTTTRTFAGASLGGDQIQCSR